MCHAQMVKCLSYTTLLKLSHLILSGRSKTHKKHSYKKIFIIIILQWSTHHYQAVCQIELTDHVANAAYN